ncbi:MAG TPA: hypothetical protein VIB00_02450, partial [Pyrinomonadaceae bacterium]
MDAMIHHGEMRLRIWNLKIGNWNNLEFSQIPNSKFQIPNPQSAIRNPQSAIRNPQSAILIPLAV